VRQALRKGMLDDLLQAGRLSFVGAPEPELQTALRIVIEGQQVVLAHYAQRSWIGAFRGAWHLFGHSHGNLSPRGRSFDVGVDVHDFRPLSFEEVKIRMDTVAEQFTEK
jgi:calcineurin-like phosphoesterase family protein